MHYSGTAATQQAAVASRDSGLLRYIARVYVLMGLGMAISGLVAFFASQSAYLMVTIFSSRVLAMAVMFAPFVLVIALNAFINRMSKSAAIGAFLLLTAGMGLSLSSIFLVFTGASIASTFGVSAGLFASMGVYGYFTKRDLTSFGSFLLMGVLGLVIAGIVNLFMQNSMLMLAFSAIGVLLFTGLTAYDTQQIRLAYSRCKSEGDVLKTAVLGALRLYITFINLFLSLLRLFGSRK
ncbi:MAG: Bax inhibitor-1/YccA family protein [Holosporales bacterium]|jgi:FtsH-binding integral membrane protein|nr:Bax inhibitor-1/YccA family protein [Holosporales bacterium]